jgi:diguanylate cyclase (GGDEF)-like protein
MDLDVPDANERHWLMSTVRRFVNRMHEEVIQPIGREVPQFQNTREIAQLLEHTTELIKLLHSTETVTSALLPYLKRAILEDRLREASFLEESKSRVSNPETIQSLGRHLAPYDRFMKDSWFLETRPIAMPRLMDVLTLERAERVLGGQLVLGPRVYNEKFHILQSHALFLPDLDYYRKTCGLRRVPVCVAFMDIDKFKDFNTDHGETHIDLYLLPRFMEALEAHFYGRGHTYQAGGDEYLAIMPNVDAKQSGEILEGLQVRLKKLSYVGITKRVTLSIGFCQVGSDCHLTNRELYQRAEQAKNYSKKHHRGSIATYEDELYERVAIVAEPTASDSGSATAAD